MAESGPEESSPYPGLRPFEEKDCNDFFGRDDEVVALLHRVLETRFLAVLGGSGAGKSSLVKAGFLSALHTEVIHTASTDTDQRLPGWRIADMRPGDGPIHELAAALSVASVFGDLKVAVTVEPVEKTLRRGPLGLVEAARAARMPKQTRLMVLVDQFEQLFRFQQTSSHLAADSDEVAAFTDLLLAAASQTEVPIYIVITMRSEYLAHCARYPQLAARITDGLYLLSPMTRDQMHEAIVEPAKRRGVSIAEPLASRLLNEVGGHADQAPMLQHTLMRLWANRPPGSTTLDLDDLGQLKPATSIGDHAELIYGQLSSEQQKIAAYVFRNITSVVGENETIRNPAKFRTIVDRVKEALDTPEKKRSRKDVADVIDVFRAEGCSMLMTDPKRPLGDDTSVDISDDTIVDISHESLIRQWKRLKDWAQENAEEIRPYLLLVEDAALWERKNKSEGWLAQGQRLADAVKWSTENPGRLGPLEEEFLTKSRGDLRPEWLTKYELYLSRAKAWKQESRSDLLLSRSELAAADAWLEQEQQNQQPKATPLQRVFIQKSRDAVVEKKSRFLRWALPVFGVVVLLLFWIGVKYALLQSYSRELARSSISEPNAETALIVATYALRASATPEATHAVHAALARSRLLSVAPLPGKGKDAPVVSSVISQDGRVLVAKYSNGRIEAVRNVGSRTVASVHDGTFKPESLIAVSRDGTTSAVAHDGVVELQKVGIGPMPKVKTGIDKPTALSLSGDGSLVAVGGPVEFKVFRTQPSNQAGKSSPSPGAGAMMPLISSDTKSDVLALDFNGDSTCLGVSDRVGPPKVYAMPKGTCPTLKQGRGTTEAEFAQADKFLGDPGEPEASPPPAQPYKLVFGSDKNVLAAVTSENVMLYDFTGSDGVPVEIFKRIGNATITGIALGKSFKARSPRCNDGFDGVIAFSWEDGRITRHSICGKQLTESAVVGWHIGKALAIAVEESKSGESKLVSVGEDGNVRTWGSTTGIELATRNLAQLGDIAFVEGSGGSALVIATDQRASAADPKTPTAISKTLERCAVRPDRPTGEDPPEPGAMICEKVDEGSQLKIGARGAYVLADNATHRLNWKSLAAASAAQTGSAPGTGATLLSIGSTGKHALLWDAATRQLQVVGRDGSKWQWSVPPEINVAYWTMAVSPDGQSFVGFPYVEVRSGEAPEGRFRTDQVAVWTRGDAKAPKLIPPGNNDIAAQSEQPKQISTIALDNSGRLLATGHVDGTVTVWDLVNVRRQFRNNYSGSRLLGVRDRDLSPTVHSLAFEPEGKLMAVGLMGAIRVLDAETGKIETGLSSDFPREPSAIPYKIALSGTRTLAVMGFDSNVRVYELDTKRLLKMARQRMQPELGKQECADYLGFTCEENLIWWAIDVIF